MKKTIAKIFALALLAGSTLTTGCANPWELGYTPAYTTTERCQIIARNWDYEGKQSQDDIDHALLLRPASRLTTWNVR
jgi:hypothetical protein